MKTLKAFFTLTVVVLAWGQRAEAGADTDRPDRIIQPSLVTVELFTSQGCSSCPEADRLLADLARRPDLLALSLPVDYWDYLGWHDTLARPENAKRQRAYAKALHTLQPYTPQMVIDGRVDVVGNNESKVGWTIENRLKQVVNAVPITIDRDAQSVAVTVGPGPSVPASLWLVRYSDEETVKIEGGENEGHTLGYAHVVKAMTPIGMWTGTAARFVLPRSDLAGAAASTPPDALAVILQQENTGPILAAARLPLN